MKLDFLDDVTDNGKYPWADPDKLLRLYNFDYIEAKQFKTVIDTAIIADQGEFDVSRLDFVQSLNCTLQFQLSKQNFGIELPPDKKSFVCMLTLEAYKTMSNVIQFFAKDVSVYGYNWLYDPHENKIDLLFSTGGDW